LNEVLPASMISRNRSQECAATLGGCQRKPATVAGFAPTLPWFNLNPFVHTLPHALRQRLPAVLGRRILSKATTGWLAPKPSPQSGRTSGGLAIAGELIRASSMG
jgi:hypothetical protein